MRESDRDEERDEKEGGVRRGRDRWEEEAQK